MTEPIVIRIPLKIELEIDLTIKDTKREVGQSLIEAARSIKARIENKEPLTVREELSGLRCPKCMKDFNTQGWYERNIKKCTVKAGKKGFEDEAPQLLEESKSVTESLCANLCGNKVEKDGDICNQCLSHYGDIETSNEDEE